MMATTTIHPTAANDAGSTGPAGVLALPIYPFAGTLREISHACVRGLWQISLLVECADTGRPQYVTLSPGRDEAGELACALQLAELVTGQRYYGRASLHRQGEHNDYFAGRVVLAADQRRPPPPLRLAASHGRATTPAEGQTA